MNNYVLWIVT